MEKIREVKLESETIFDGKIVKLTKDKVRCPNGRETTREVIKHCGASCVVAVHNDKIIMEKQYRYPFDEVMIEIPAGKLDKGEDVLECARRELEEETGYTVKSIEPLTNIYTAIAYCNEIIYVYFAKVGEKKEQHLDEDEYVEVKKYSLEELENMILNGTIQDTKTISSILAYKLKYLK